MTDTIRTVPALQALLADGATANSTNRQLLRDMLVSLDNGTSATVTETALRVSADLAAAQAIPRGGRTVTLLPNYLNNNAIFNVKDFGAVGDGVTDDAAAILATDTAAGATTGGLVSFPPGTYKTSQNLICARRWVGVPGATIIQPTSAVTKCVDLRTGGHGYGIDLDGVNTSGKTGLDVGSALLVNILSWENSRIHNFLGVGGRGIKVVDLVTGRFVDLYVDTNYINLHTKGTQGTPTNTAFHDCDFRSATTKGVWIENGYGVRLYKPNLESNGEEGLYVQNTGDNVAELGIYEPWYEANWQSVASGAARHSHYHFFVDGANGPCGTIRFSQRDAKFNEGVTDPRAMHLTNCTGFKDYNAKVANEAGQVLVDGTSYGDMEWNGQNGSFLTTVTNTSGGAWNSRTHIEAIEAAWTDYTPVVTASGSMTIASLIVRKARYQTIGKTFKLKLYLGFTTGGVASTTVSVTLPTNIRTLDANEYPLARMTNNGVGVVGAAHADGASPTTSVAFTILAGGNWALTINQEVLFYGEFELF